MKPTADNIICGQDISGFVSYVSLNSRSKCGNEPSWQVIKKNLVTSPAEPKKTTDRRKIMDEKILEKLEQDKFKSQKQAVLALKKDFESHHITTPEKKQEYVNDIYRSLSDTGAANFDKVINEYNKELNVDDQIKTYQDSIKQYNTEISRIAALFIEYGTEYQSNAEIDFFLKEQFASIADRVETGCIQDIIDAANLKLTQEMRRNKCSVE